MAIAETLQIVVDVIYEIYLWHHMNILKLSAAASAGIKLSMNACDDWLPQFNCNVPRRYGCCCCYLSVSLHTIYTAEAAVVVVDGGGES